MGNMFNLFGAGGGKSEGLYIWKKYKLIPAEYASNPSFTLGAPKSGNYTINISNPSFDLSNIPTLGSSGVAPFGDLQGDDYKKVIDFFDGFRFDDTCYIEKSVYDASRGNSLRYHNNGNTWWISGFYKSSSSYGFYVYQATANGVSATLTYTGEKELVPARTGDFIGYVVSDDSTKYPDKAEQDGFYYEKVELTLDAFGCTKCEVGSFTPTSNTRIQTISHNFGAIPKMLLVWTDETVGYNNERNVTAFNTSDGSQGYVSISESYLYARADYAGSNSTANAKVYAYAYDDSYFYFKSGTKYNYVLLG